MEDESKYHDYLNDQKPDLSDKEMKDFLDQSSHAQIPASTKKEEIWRNIDASTKERPMPVSCARGCASLLRRILNRPSVPNKVFRISTAAL